MDEALENAKKYNPNAGRLWEQETPLVLRSRSNTFRYYRAQQMLVVSRPDFVDQRTGVLRLGKSVLVQLDDLIEEPDTLDALLEILQAAREKAR